LHFPYIRPIFEGAPSFRLKGAQRELYLTCDRAENEMLVRIDQRLLALSVEEPAQGFLVFKLKVGLIEGLLKEKLPIILVKCYYVQYFGSFFVPHGFNYYKPGIDRIT